VTEPERALAGIVNDEAGGRGAELREYPHALTPPAEAMTPQDLLHPTRRDHEPSLGEVMRVAASSQGGAHHRFGEDFVDHPRRGLVNAKSRSRRPVRVRKKRAPEPR
jgi:hypothetical protein